MSLDRPSPTFGRRASLLMIVAGSLGCRAPVDIDALCKRQVEVGCLAAEDGQFCVQESKALMAVAEKGGCTAEVDEHFSCVDMSTQSDTCDGCGESIIKLAVCLAQSGDLDLSTAGGLDPCARYAHAGQLLLDVIPARLACESDSDCATVEIVGDCFNKCTHVVAANADLGFFFDQESQWCEGFTEAGCSVERPVCVPPSEPRCMLGKCQ